MRIGTGILRSLPQMALGSIAETAMGAGPEGRASSAPTTAGGGPSKLGPYFVQSPRRLPEYFIVITCPARFIFIVPV